ncbi:hypothetical protein Clacol_009396 [Clathrus columnatus]|uniref:UDENN domain-containing protein n=1 Tax=Clathrus columnatus TaxID=1419009 RepID=A0AAV5AKD1_9AGAM|nr:hypothetical protein Clacol_009396 [Clathrus columnatus]
MVRQGSARHVSFVLLAEFDIDTGASLARQFPQPLGVENDQLIAELMIPEGVHRNQEDWTYFMLNQTPDSTVEPVIADADSITGSVIEGSSSELLYVLNLVRTNRDKTLRRGAEVKALAICTRLPYIQLFKPVLWIALQEYFNDPSDDCITRLYDAVNAMDISLAPTLCREEKLIMRSSERKDVFIEKFMPPDDATVVGTASTTDLNSQSAMDVTVRPRTDSLNSLQSSLSKGGSNESSGGSSVVWIGSNNPQDSHRPRSSLDGVSNHHHNGHSTNSADSHPQLPKLGSTLDTHFYDTTIMYKKMKLKIRVPLTTFPEEVGDYSLIQLIQTFSNPNATISGPLHSHLHTNGYLTHPIILLFNALVTGKRIVFLGHGKPASVVANYVLAACALGSGCGAVLRGFTSRAYPYTCLAQEAALQTVTDFIAGVTNPIFESMPIWDVLCDINTGKITISKDIRPVAPPPSLFPSPPPIVPRSGTVRSDSSGYDDEIVPLRRESNTGKEFVAKSDHPDNLFMEDILSAISCHYGEGLIRTRMTEYSLRFVRLAARYEEEFGSTEIGHPTAPFEPPTPEFPHGRLGSGIAFLDDVAGSRELLANASRIEGWRHTKSYEHFKIDFQTSLDTKAIQGFDIAHQLWRLRHTKNLSDAEVELIMRTLVDSVRSYDQVVELLSLLPAHAGGLIPISFGLFHQQETIRDLTVDLLTALRAYPIGVQFLQTLNHFHKYGYVRQAYARELRLGRDKVYNGLIPPTSTFSRLPSNLSEASLTA